MAIEIDLYSDTITLPSRAMREFMLAAPVGDDQKGEDPTVNELQALVAELTGKEAAVFLPSATMSNQIAFKCHTQPGDEAIADENSHCLHYEAGGPAFHSGVMVRTLRGERGTFTAAQVAAAVRPAGNLHMPETRLVWVENTHNAAGGTIWPLDRLAAVAAAARERGLGLHMDGARLWNAAVAAGVAPAVFTAHADTVTVCLSKGLGCPAGALLAGPAVLIARARKYKHLFGGAMRQSGILAAAGIYAFRHNVARMAEDHANARRLARGLAAVPGLVLDPDSIETNMVFFDVAPRLGADRFAAACLARGVRFSPAGAGRLRAVTHLDVDAAAIDRAVAVAEATAAALRG